MNTPCQNKKNAEIIGVSSLSENGTIKSRFKDGHAPALKLLKGRERPSESRDLRPAPVEKPLDFRPIKNAEIIGVFSKAVYCECDNEVFVFHDKSWGYVPFGIAVDGIEEFIKNGDFAVGKTVEVPEIEREKAAFGAHSVPKAARIAEVQKVIETEGSSGGIIECYNTFKSAKASIDGLFAALCDGGDAADHAVKLIGLGRGLTPSGDDFLCGMFSLFFAAEKCGVRIPSAVQECAAAVKENLSRTSKISAAYLDAVLKKERFTLYENAVLSLLGDSAEYAKEVLPLGASSGTDTLCGALFAAKVIAK